MQKLCVIGISLLLCSMVLTIQPIKGGTEKPKRDDMGLARYSAEEKPIKEVKSYKDKKSHRTIKIDGDTDFRKTAKAEGWEGEGTKTDPYLIKGLKIAGRDYGIYIGNTTVHFKIKDCWIGSGPPNFTSGWLDRLGAAIYLDHVENGNITGNTIPLSTFGVYLDHSSGTTLHHNSIKDNSWGVFLSSSTHITLKNNRLTNDTVNIAGKKLRYWNTHVIPKTNMVNDKEIIYWKDRETGDIAGEPGQVILVNCTGVTVKDKKLTKVEVGFSSNNEIVGNLIKIESPTPNSYGGISLHTSSRNKLIDNEVRGLHHGVILRNSDDNVITGLNASNNAFGVYLWNSSGNFLDRSRLVNNSAGISLAKSDDNRIKNNHLMNRLIGIRLEDSKNNLITKNTIFNNSRGVTLINSRANDIYINNFIDNGQQAYLSGGSKGENEWSNEEGEGNYWSDYDGLDDGSNDRTAGDGIGDTQIPHPKTDKDEGYYHLDNHPLVRSWPEVFLPSSPRQLKTDPGEKQVNLSWSPPEDTVTDRIIHYKIYRGLSRGDLTYHHSVEGDITSYTDDNVTGGQTYYYKVSAVTETGEGNLTDVVNATPSDTGGENGSIPGFTSPLVMIALFLLLIYQYKRKRASDRIS